MLAHDHRRHFVPQLSHVERFFDESNLLNEGLLLVKIRERLWRPC